MIKTMKITGLTSLALLLGMACSSDSNTPAPGSDAGSDAAAADGATGGTGGTSADASVDDDASPGGDEDAAAGGMGGNTSSGDNPCGDVDLKSSDPFTLNFGAAGTFSFLADEDSTSWCQFAGIRTGYWDGEDGTKFEFVAGIAFEETTTGSEFTNVTFNWDRTSRSVRQGMLLQADLFSGKGKLKVIAGDVSGTKPWAPATICIYDVEPLTHLTDDETATLSAPVALPCN